MRTLAFAAFWLLAASPVFARSSGIPVVNGDTVTTAIQPAGDHDDFAVKGMSQGSLTVTVIAAKGGGLELDIKVFDPDGKEIDLTEIIRAYQGAT